VQKSWINPAHPIQMKAQASYPSILVVHILGCPDSLKRTIKCFRIDFIILGHYFTPHYLQFICIRYFCHPITYLARHLSVRIFNPITLRLRQVFRLYSILLPFMNRLISNSSCSCWCFYPMKEIWLQLLFVCWCFLQITDFILSFNIVRRFWTRRSMSYLRFLFNSCKLWVF